MENTGVARTDLMVAGCAVPFSIVGFSGQHFVHIHTQQGGRRGDGKDGSRVFLLDPMLRCCVAGTRAESGRLPSVRPKSRLSQ